MHMQTIDRLGCKVILLQEKAIHQANEAGHEELLQLLKQTVNELLQEQVQEYEGIMAVILA